MDKANEPLTGRRCSPSFLLLAAPREGLLTLSVINLEIYNLVAVGKECADACFTFVVG